MKFYLVGLVIMAGLLVFRATRTEVRAEAETRSWIRGDADVLEVRELPASPGSVRGGTPPRYAVRARVRTSDGRRSVAWAAGRYARHVTAWTGRTVPAWHDPAHPERFRLRPPSEPTLRAILAAVLPLVLVAALIVAIAALVTQ